MDAVWRRTEATVCKGCEARSARHLVDKAKFVSPGTFHTEKMCFGGKCKICSSTAKNKVEARERERHKPLPLDAHMGKNRHIPFIEFIEFYLDPNEPA